MTFRKLVGRSKPYLFIKNTIIYLFYYLPIDSKKIVFDNFGGRGYGDDPKYIAEELLKRNQNLKLIWVSNNTNIDLPEGIQCIKYGTICAAYHWATAKIWIDNIKNSSKVKKKPGQFYIQTWHSTLGFKMNEQDADTLPSKYINQAIFDASQTNLMYSNNDFRVDKYKNRYWYSGEVIKCDVPRMSIIYKKPDYIVEKVRASLGIEDGKKIVLYAPTFRKNSNLETYKFNYNSVKNILEKRFGVNLEFVLRLHPNEADKSDLLSKEMNIINASLYPDMQELLATVDYLITDYSGIMFDFAFANKPVFLFSKDHNDYLKKERKVYFTLNDIPFEFATDEKQLLHNISEFDEDVYIQKIHSFKNKIGYNDSGNGDIVIADIILKKIYEGRAK